MRDSPTPPPSHRTNWGATFLVTKTFHSLSAALGTGVVFWMYGLLTAGALVFVLVVVPETRGRCQIVSSFFCSLQKS